MLRDGATAPSGLVVVPVIRVKVQVRARVRVRVRGGRPHAAH